MTRTTWTITAALFLATGAVLLVKWAPWRADKPPAAVVPTSDLVEERRAALDAAVKEYKPRRQLRIVDLFAPVAAMLRTLPGVA